MVLGRRRERFNMNYIEKFVLAVSCNMSLCRKNGKPGDPLADHGRCPARRAEVVMVLRVEIKG